MAEPWNILKEYRVTEKASNLSAVGNCYTFEVVADANREKNGITIEHGKGMDLLDQFTDIYNATMDKDHAEEYYYFKRPFYESIHNDLKDNYEIFYAVYEGRPVAMSIMLFGNKQMHYHLSGSMIEYRNLAPSNLLLYKAALWGCEQGYKTFHLGGGVGSGEDNLYKFKAAFNKVSDYQFSIGKEIYDEKIYNELVMERKNRDVTFNLTSTFFPLYRNNDNLLKESDLEPCGGGYKYLINSRIPSANCERRVAA